MAQGKKSIVVYSDWDEYFSDLSDEEAGKLIKHFFDYVNDKNPVLNNRVLEMAFKPIKNQLKRDLDKWEETKKKRSDAGRLGGIKSGEVRNQTEANEANASITKQTEANEAVNVICNNVLDVNVNDILLEKETKEILFEKPKRAKKELPQIIINYPLPFSEQFSGAWKNWLEFKKSQFGFVYKTDASIKTALWDLVTKSKDNEENAIKIINNSIANGYRGLFELKNNNNGQPTITTAKPKFRNAINNFVNNNQQTEVGDSKGEFFEDTECTIVE